MVTPWLIVIRAHILASWKKTREMSTNESVNEDVAVTNYSTNHICLQPIRIVIHPTQRVRTLSVHVIRSGLRSLSSIVWEASRTRNMWRICKMSNLNDLTSGWVQWQHERLDLPFLVAQSLDSQTTCTRNKRSNCICIGYIMYTCEEYIVHIYIRIAGNFWGRKLSQIGEKDDIHGKNFCGLLACAVPKDTTPPNFAKKTFTNSHKTAKFVKVFSLESSRYTVVHSICILLRQQIKAQFGVNYLVHHANLCEYYLTVFT